MAYTDYGNPLSAVREDYYLQYLFARGRARQADTVGVYL